MTGRAEEILNSGNDKQLLKLFRDETTLIVLMVRVRNEERRQEWDARQEEIMEQDEALSQWPAAFAELGKEIE